MGYDKNVISRDQVDDLVAIVRNNAIDPEDAKAIVKQHAGVDSSQDIPVERYEVVKAMLNAAALGAQAD
jgi:hypothetical protein